MIDRARFPLHSFPFVDFSTSASIVQSSGIIFHHGLTLDTATASLACDRHLTLLLSC